MTQFGWDAGCGHPDVAALVADTRATAGTEADLQAAVDVCHIVLATDRDSTAPFVQRLHATHARLSGLLARSRGRDTGIVDDNGNVTYAPRHQPTDPKRPVRPSAGSAPDGGPDLNQLRGHHRGLPADFSSVQMAEDVTAEGRVSD